MHDMWGETGGSETPASRTFYSRFPPPSEGVPDSLFYLYCKMLRNIAKFFSFLPGPATLGILLPARTPPAPYSPGLPSPCPPPLIWVCVKRKLQICHWRAYFAKIFI